VKEGHRDYFFFFFALILFLLILFSIHPRRMKLIFLVGLCAVNIAIRSVSVAGGNAAEIQTRQKIDELEPVKFEGGRPGATSTVNLWNQDWSPGRAFQRQSPDVEADSRHVDSRPWLSGGVPATVYYNFPYPITVAKFSFRNRREKAHSANNPEQFEFVGSDDCESWTVIRVVSAVDWGMKQDEEKIWTIDQIDRKKFKCFGIRVLSISGNNHAAIQDLKMWKASQKCTRSSKIDLQLIVDSSTSIGEKDFHKMMAAIADGLISQFDIAEDKTRVALFKYSSKNIMVHEIPFDSYGDADSLKAAIKATKFERGVTFTAQAMTEALAHYKTGMRDDGKTAKVCLVFTDGDPTSQSEKDKVPAASEDWARIGTTVFAVGIGSTISEKGLNDIAGSGDRIMRVTDFEAIKGEAESLLDKVCAAVQPQTSGCREYFVLRTKQSWSEAKSACEAEGAELAKLSTPAEVEKAAEKTEDETFYWIGGHCPDCRRKDVRDDEWKWIDGEKIPLDHPYFKPWTVAGKTNKSPYDTDGDAKWLTLYRSGNDAQFVNSCCGQRMALCQHCPN